MYPPDNFRDMIIGSPHVTVITVKADSSVLLAGSRPYIFLQEFKENWVVPSSCNRGSISCVKGPKHILMKYCPLQYTIALPTKSIIQFKLFTLLILSIFLLTLTSQNRGSYSQSLIWYNLFIICSYIFNIFIRLVFRWGNPTSISRFAVSLEASHSSPLQQCFRTNRLIVPESVNTQG